MGFVRHRTSPSPTGGRPCDAPVPILLFASLSLLASCSSRPASSNGNNGGSPGPATLSGVSVSPNAASVGVSSSVSFKATGQYSDGTTQDLTPSAQWSSSDSSVAGISSPGVVTGTCSGTATISAQSGGFSGSASLTVNSSGGSGGSGGSGTGAGGAASANLASITITPANPSVPIRTGGATHGDGNLQRRQQCRSDYAGRVGLLFDRDCNHRFAWCGCRGGPRHNQHLCKFRRSFAIDHADRTAPTLVSIAVTPVGLTLGIGINQQFVATATYSDGSSADLVSGVTWTSSSTTVATINSAGLAATVAAGSTTITATVGSFTDTSTLTVVAAHLISISVTPAIPSIALGTSSCLPRSETSTTEARNGSSR